MNPVNGVVTDSKVNTLNPAEMSKQDFISAVYLERGEMLDSEVRRIIGEIDKSNQYVDAINGLLGKANLAEYGDNYYSSATWQVNGNSVVLDNGYGLNVQPDGNGGSMMTLMDAEGNQLIYQNQTLIPVPAGTTIDALESGIPVMNDMSFMLDDGTKITLITTSPDDAFDQTNLSGGLANIKSVVISRDNQSISIDKLNTASPKIYSPTIEAPTDTGEPEVVPVKTETISIPSHTLRYMFDDEGSWQDYDFIDNGLISRFKSTWLNVLDRKSPAEQEAMMKKLREEGSMDIYYRLGDSDGEDGTWSHSYSYPVYANDTIISLVNRVLDRSAPQFRNYIDSKESGDIDIEYVYMALDIPGYSFESPIPDTEKTTSSMDSKSFSNNVSWDKEVEEYSMLYTRASQLASDIKSTYLTDLTPEQREGLKRKLMVDGADFDWYIEEVDNTDNEFDRDYNLKLISGETLEGYIDRAADLAAKSVSAYIRHDHDEDHIEMVRVDFSIDLPGYSYDVYEEPIEKPEDSNPARPINIHTDDANTNDGHILIESGGIHSWEYGGKSVSSLTSSDPNDPNNLVTGYFARKIAFQDSKTEEYSGTTPLLTQKETELLTKILKIPYADASSNGQLTPEEWVDLKQSLINARDNLNGNSQLQTVQLQRAMQTYNQNYDAMSNAQQKIYSLLRDIISNIK